MAPDGANVLFFDPWHQGPSPESGWWGHARLFERKWVEHLSAQFLFLSNRIQESRPAAVPWLRVVGVVVPPPRPKPRVESGDHETNLNMVDQLISYQSAPFSKHRLSNHDWFSCAAAKALG